MSLLSDIPKTFDVNAHVKQDKPFSVEVRIGQKVVLVALAGFVTLLLWKKVK